MAEEGSREGWRRRAVLATAAAGLASLAGCGGGADRTKANLRFVNASAYGVIDTALKSGVITQVLGAEHGIKGVLSDRLFDMGLHHP